MSAVLQTKVLRCAVYTRKSTDEGLDQEFTSIDAQFESGTAYIASQKNEGWQWCGQRYDDPDYSGGTLDRPALKRLIKDVEAGRIDIIIVYKIDRWVRSLRDFFSLADVLDRHGVAFVSVTQQFNTATAMGRLIMNVLLAFAQFEREQGAERVRDKIAASKKKGMWMGGVPSLGYRVANKKLEVVLEEAERVRYIFRRFAEIGTSALVKELQERGIRSKSWTAQSGVHHPGRILDKSGLYKILHNRIYLGEISHKDKWYSGEHAPILTLDEWDAAHARLKGVQRASRGTGRTPFLLKGMVFGEDGRAMTPWFTNKGGARTYRYYLPARDNKEHAGASGLPRIPAVELESLVVEQMRGALRGQAMMAAICERVAKLDPAVTEAHVYVAMKHVDEVWKTLFPAEQARIVQLILDRVVVSPRQIELRFRPDGVRRLAGELSVVAGSGVA